jgi:predicted transcriptional regulator
MPPSREPLGHLELDALQYIVDHHPITVREVAAHFALVSGHARTTLLTVMERLRAKGYLKRRKVAGVHRYTPTLQKAELLHGIIRDFVDDVLGGSVSPFLAYLNRSARLTDEEAGKLAQLLKRIESRDPKGKP